MKKKYIKPYIAVESFQLNAAVASGCNAEIDGKIAINHGLDTCTADEEAPGLNYIGNLCIHDVKVEGDGNDVICYHGPTPVSSMFLNS